MLANGSITSFRGDICDTITTSTDNSSGNSQSLGSQGLLEFLREADLQDYFDHLSVQLKVRSVTHLKYVDDTDLISIGMTRPEMRRLRKFFEKQCPQTAMGKIKKRLSRNASNRSVSVPPVSDFSTARAHSYCVRSNYDNSSNYATQISVGGVGAGGGNHSNYTQTNNNNSNHSQTNSHVYMQNHNHNTSRISSPLSISNVDDQTTTASVANFSISSNGTNDSSSSGDFRITGNKHLILHNQLHIEETLRKGEFSDISEGRLNINNAHSEIRVLVKTIGKTQLKADLNEFIKEIFVNCYLDHQNITRFFGISLDDHTIKLVTEYSEIGSLEDVLSSDPKARLTYPVPMIHNFTVQVAKAMNYLEEHRIVHGNLHARNVMLFTGKQVKVTDIGLFRAHMFSIDSTLTRSTHLSRAAGQTATIATATATATATTTKITTDNSKNTLLCSPRLPIPPELTPTEYHYSSSSSQLAPVPAVAPKPAPKPVPTSFSDVWCFGMLVWHLFNYVDQKTLQRLLPNTDSNSDDDDNNHHNQLKSKLPVVATTNFHCFPSPDLCPSMIYELVKLCWSVEPTNRPSFFQLSTQIIRIHPERLVALYDGPDPEPESGSIGDLQMLEYYKDDVIVVLDRSMTRYKDYWKGCLLDGSWGYFRWSKMRAESVDVIANGPSSSRVSRSNVNNGAVIRSQSLSKGVGDAFAKLRLTGRRDNPNQHQSSHNHNQYQRQYQQHQYQKDNNRNNNNNSKRTTMTLRRGRLSVDMISAPSNDFRHIGHVGCNGDVFGDVTTLYTAEAQQKIRAGVLTVDSKVKNSETRSNSTLKSAGDDTPPYATIDNNNEVLLIHKNSLDLTKPPVLPQRNNSCGIEDTPRPISQDEFSLFDELSKQWEMASSKLDPNGVSNSNSSNSNSNSNSNDSDNTNVTCSKSLEFDLFNTSAAQIEVSNKENLPKFDKLATVTTTTSTAAATGRNCSSNPNPNPAVPPKTLSIKQPITTEQQHPHILPPKSLPPSSPPTTHKSHKPTGCSKPKSPTGFFHKFIKHHTKDSNHHNHQQQNYGSSSSNNTPITNAAAAAAAAATKDNQSITTVDSKSSSSSPVYAKIQKQQQQQQEKIASSSSSTVTSKATGNNNSGKSGGKKENKKESKKDKKKNLISGPVLISRPLPVAIEEDYQQQQQQQDEEQENEHPAAPCLPGGSNNIADDIFLDCTSEVSSLQPSPKESLMGLNNSSGSPDNHTLSGVEDSMVTTAVGGGSERTSSYTSYRSSSSQMNKMMLMQFPQQSVPSYHHSQMITEPGVAVLPRAGMTMGYGNMSGGMGNDYCNSGGGNQHKYSSQSSTTTSISPASSLASLGSIPSCNMLAQSGSALRVLKKGDGVFRANTGATALNRRRPSAGFLDSGFVEAGTLSRNRQPSLPCGSLMGAMPSAKSSVGTLDWRMRQQQQQQYQQYQQQQLDTPDNMSDSDATTPVAVSTNDSRLPGISSSSSAAIRAAMYHRSPDEAYHSRDSAGSETLERPSRSKRRFDNDGSSSGSRNSTNVNAINFSIPFNSKMILNSEDEEEVAL